MRVGSRQLGGTTGLVLYRSSLFGMSGFLFPHPSPPLPSPEISQFEISGEGRGGTPLQVVKRRRGHYESCDEIWRDVGRERGTDCAGGGDCAFGSEERESGRRRVERDVGG